jgi:hypothetical protein
MKALHVVQTNARPGRLDEFNEWYDTVHIPDVLSIPGVLSARRYQLAQTQLGRASREYPYRFLTLYELEDDAAEVVQAIDAAITSGRFSLSSALDPSYVAPIFEPLSEHRPR